MSDYTRRIREIELRMHDARRAIEGAELEIAFWENKRRQEQDVKAYVDKAIEDACKNLKGEILEFLRKTYGGQ